MIYDTLTVLSQRIKREREKVTSLLSEAEENLLKLELDVTSEVEMGDGAYLRFDGGLIVAFKANGLCAPTRKHWRECPPDVQINAVFALKPLLEKMEEVSSKLLNDLQTVQELAEEAGIISKAIDKASSAFYLDPEITASLPEEEPAKDNGVEVGTTSVYKLPDTIQPSLYLRPFRRFARPSGPVPPVDDVDGQRQYAMKLILWFFTHKIEETGYESLRSLLDDNGILRSRGYNAMPYIKKNFSYLFSRVTGKPVLHDIKLVSNIDQMFDFSSEEVIDRIPTE